MRLAAACHLYRHGLKGLEQPISTQDFTIAQGIAEVLQSHHFFLVNPLGLAAKENAKKIAAHLMRITSPSTQYEIINTGLTTKEVAAKTGLRKLEANNALYYLYYANWAAIHDDGSGILRVRFRPEIFTQNL